MLFVQKCILVSHISVLLHRKMGIKSRPLMDTVAQRLSEDTQFKLAHEKLLEVEQQHKQLVQEVGTQCEIL